MTANSFPNLRKTVHIHAHFTAQDWSLSGSGLLNIAAHMLNRQLEQFVNAGGYTKNDVMERMVTYMKEEHLESEENYAACTPFLNKVLDEIYGE